MKQLNFFDDHLAKIKSCDKKEINYWKLYIDGASRNNPGPAGVGVYLIKNDKLAVKKGFYIGIKTNNQAEYMALLLGIFYLKKNMCKDDIALIVSDSQLLVRQLEGSYKVKNPDLKIFYQLAKRLLHDINYNILHVLREDNKDADQMANVGIDSRKKLPQEFIKMLQSYEIQL